MGGIEAMRGMHQSATPERSHTGRGRDRRVIDMDVVDPMGTVVRMAANRAGARGGGW